jgi:hypothetical protein
MLQPHQFLASLSDYGAWSWIGLAILLPLAIVGLVIAILFLLNLQNLLKTISAQNRKMDPSMVWLALIPVFQIVWMFIVVSKISESIQAEYSMRGLAVESKPTYSIGLAMCILNVCCIIPFVNFLAGIALLICIILYWIKTSEFKNAIKQLPAYTDAEGAAI